MNKKINDEKEVLNALNRLDTLMFEVVPGTPEGDELENLSKMIENYENTHDIIIDKSTINLDNNLLKFKYKSKYNIK